MDARIIFEKKSTTAGERALTKDQVKKLLSVITDVEHQALLTLAIYTGIRRADIVAIERNNIDFEKHSIIFFEHKKDKLHKIFMNEKVEQALKMWMTPTKSKWLFPSKHQNRKHLSPKTAYNILQFNLRRAGLSAIPFHALRSTCVKLHQLAGVTPEQTAKLINDKLSTVQAHYTTPTEEEMKRAVRGIELI